MDIPLQFKELHLFPRVLFAIGASFFFYGFINKDWSTNLFGLGVLLFAVAYNFALLVMLNRHNKRDTDREKTEYHALIVHSILAFLASAVAFYLMTHLVVPQR